MRCFRLLRCLFACCGGTIVIEEDGGNYGTRGEVEEGEGDHKEEENGNEEEEKGEDGRINVGAGEKTVE